MTQADLSSFENLFMALADKTRLRLLALMAEGEVSVGYLAEQLGESQPKISRHLAYLRSMGLTTTRRDGKRIYYGIETQIDPRADLVLNTILSAITSTVATSDPKLIRRPASTMAAASVPQDNVTDRPSSEIAIYLL